MQDNTSAKIREIELTHKQAAYWRAIFNAMGQIASNNYNEFAYYGGYGSGKSLVTMLATHTICKQYPGTHWLYCRSTYPELKDSVIPQYLELTGGYDYTYKKVDRNIEYANGSIVYFRAYDTDTKILSNQYHGVTFCQAEEIEYELYLQTLGRLRLKGLGKNIVMLEGNPAGGWIKERLKGLILPANTFLVEARTEDNPHLDAEYIKRMRDNYPEHWCRRYLDGEWSNVDEMVFSEFIESKHVDDVLDMEYSRPWRKMIGMDYGWRNPSAMVWGTVDYDGNLWIYDEWMDNEQTAEQLAEVNKRHGRISTVCDYSIKRPDRDGRSLWDDLARMGMLLIESNKQELQNITLINMLLKQGKLKICRNCVQLIKQIRDYKWKRIKLGQDKHFPETPIDKDNHLIDALLYLSAELEQWRSIDPGKEAFKKTLAYATISREKAGWRELA